MSNSLTLPNLFDVQNKIIVITGGGTGLGKIIATAFATNGAKVYITGRRKEVLDQSAKEINEAAKGRGSAIAIQGDVSTKEKVKAFAAQIAEKEDHVDTLINCAGIMIGYKKPNTEIHDLEKTFDKLDSVEDEDFATSFSINVAGPYFCTIAFIPLLKKSENASVINVASIAAYGLQRKWGSVIYGTSKRATIGLSEKLASHLIPYKIRVNCILPGLFPSEMTGEQGGELSDAVKELIPTIPRERAGLPEEIAGPCIMPASAAGGYINNAEIVIDGGRLMTVSSTV